MKDTLGAYHQTIPSGSFKRTPEVETLTVRSALAYLSKEIEEASETLSSLESNLGPITLPGAAISPAMSLPEGSCTIAADLIQLGSRIASLTARIRDLNTSLRL